MRYTVLKSIKLFIRGILPHAVVVLYRRRNGVPPQTKPLGTTGLAYLGSVSDDELLNILKDEGSGIYFGQSGEDAVMNRIFYGKRDGFYVDVGAYNPTKYSNTYAFYRLLGWRGINIDADENAIKMFQKSRPKDINLNVAIGEVEGLQTMTRYDSAAIGTFSDYNRSRQAKRGHKVIGTKEMMVQPLNKILDEHVPRGQHIDVLDIDVEGYDLQALKTNDWEKYRPSVILIEDYAINTKGFNKSEVFKFMRGKDYRFFSHAYDTSIYVDNKDEKFNF